jgi:hypothetical protein
MRKFSLFLFSLFIVSACAPSTPPTVPEVIPVYSTAAAQPWLYDLYDCAGTASVIERVDDPSAAAVILRVGEPDSLSSPAYQIDTEEILVVTQRQSRVRRLSLSEARALFTGLGDPLVQVWAYSSGEDVQVMFDRLVMQDQNISPAARLAVDPQQMSDMLINEPDTVGILPRHWKAGDVREVLSAGQVPVLAIASKEPQGVVKQLIACLQK